MFKRTRIAWCLLSGLLLLPTSSFSGGNHNDAVVPIHKVSADGIGTEVGTITAHDTQYGLLLTPNLSNLKPGIHGFHLHQNADCNAGMKEGKKAAALAAGGHFDPKNTGHHAGPFGDGHLGDLPALSVTEDGKATLPVLAPRLKAKDLHHHSFVIHEGGDNYSDHPELGGGGTRVECGVIQ